MPLVHRLPPIHARKGETSLLLFASPFEADASSLTPSQTLLLLNYLDVLRALKLPVTAVRLVTDPTINFVHLVGSRYILPPLDAALLPLIQVALSFLPPKAVVPVETAAEPSTLSLLLTIAQEKLLVVFTLAEQGLDRVCGLVSPDIASDSPPSAAWSYVVSKAPVIELLASTAVILGKEIGDAFALVGLVSRCAVDLVESIVEGRVDSVGFAALAQGDTSADRFFAIWVGYSSVILFLLLWFGTTSDKKGWGKATKEVFKQNAIVISEFVCAYIPRFLRADFLSSSCRARLLHEHRAHRLSARVRNSPRLLSASAVPREDGIGESRFPCPSTLHLNLPSLGRRNAVSLIAFKVWLTNADPLFSS